MLRKSLYFFFFFSLSWGPLVHATNTNGESTGNKKTERNFYDILGVEITATPEEIKKAFRHKTMFWHPDHQSGNEIEATKEFQRIKEAYDTLRDPHKRSDYDSKGHEVFTESSQTQKSRFEAIWERGFEVSQKEDVLLTSHEKKALQEFSKLSFFQNSLDNFIKEEKEYKDLLNKEKEKTLSAEGRTKLQNYKETRQKDLNTFRRAIIRLGLPAVNQHPVLLEMYLEGAKNEWMQKGLNKSVLTLAGLLENPNSSERSSFVSETSRFHEKKLTATLQEIKNHLDMVAYEGLRAQANPITFQSIRSFPVQFLMFSFAMGASIYAHSVYEKNSLGTATKPGELSDTAKHLLTPYGIFNFWVFVTVSQQVHYRVYGLGRGIDGKSLKSHIFTGYHLRALSGSVGLGTGFFISSVLTELWQDEALSACVKSSFKHEEGASAYQDHISSCEQFALNWKASEKWKVYAVDIASLIGASILSHKIVNSLVNSSVFAIKKTGRGERLVKNLTKKLGSRALGLVSFGFNFLAFIEVHKFLDNWLGKPLKQQFVSRGVDKSLEDLTDDLFSIFKEIDFSTDSDQESNEENPWLQKPTSFPQSAPNYSQETDYLQETYPFFELKQKINDTGYRFQKWTQIMNLDYQYSSYFWKQSSNNKLMNYHLSSAFLKELINDTPSDNLLKNFGRKLELSDSNTPYIFRSDIVGEDIEFYKDKYCETINQIFEEEEDSVWKKICDNGSFYVDQESEALTLFETAKIVNTYLDNIFFKDFQSEIQEICFNGYGEDDSNYLACVAFFYNGNVVDEQKIQEICRNHPRKNDSDYSDCINRLNNVGDISNLGQKILTNYISFKAGELFSSDPKFSLESLKYQNHQYSVNYHKSLFILAKQFLSVGEVKLLEEVKQDVALKYLLAGFYLLRQVFQIQTLPSFLNQPALEENISPFLDLIEVYKKGEKFFLNQTLTPKEIKNFIEIMDSSLLGDLLNDPTVGNLPYVIQALLCGNHESISDKFNVPHFFEKEIPNIQVYNFDKNDYQSLKEHCNTSTGLWQRFLFHTPTQYYQTERYENLYLLLHQILDDKYKKPDNSDSQNHSSLEELREARILPLQQAYDESSSDELDRVRESIFEGLDILQCKYYNKSIAEDSEVNPESSLDEFSEYYTQDKVGWNWCKLADKATFSLLECEEEGFKEIELAIFQVNYWLENLKNILKKGQDGTGYSSDSCQSLTLNQKGLCGNNYPCECGDNTLTFNSENFEEMQRMVLSCLQAQHDYFKFNSEISKEDIKDYCSMEDIEDHCSMEDMEDNSTDDKNPEKISAEHNMEGILCSAFSNNNSFLENSVGDKRIKPNTNYKDIVESVLSALYKSLQNYYSSITPLKLRGGIQERYLKEEAVQQNLCVEE